MFYKTKQKNNTFIKKSRVSSNILGGNDKIFSLKQITW